MPGDLPTDFAALLAGLVGDDQAGVGDASDSVLASPLEEQVDGASEFSAEGMTDLAMPTPEIPAPPQPLPVPDLLARMVPPQPILAPPEATLAVAAGGQGAIAPPGFAAAAAAAASPLVPAAPGDLPTDPVTPSGPQLDLPVMTEAITAPDSKADARRPVTATAPPHTIAAPTEQAASASSATMTEPPPPSALRDAPQPALAEAIAAGPETPPSATGSASAPQIATSAPEPPAAPSRPNAPIPWPARQVVPFVVSLALGSDDSINLTLEPIELGRVEVAITRGSEAHVSLRAERPETLVLLQRDRAELERALAGTGFGTEGRTPSLSFGLGSGGSGENRRDRRPAARDGQAAQAAMHGPSPTLQQATPTARGLIDLAF